MRLFDMQWRQIWLGLLASISLIGASTPASAGCRVVVKGFDYQALECDSYVPVVNELSTAIEIAKRTINAPGCMEKLSAVVGSASACSGEIYLAAVALWESYAALEKAATLREVIDIGGEVYVLVEGSGTQANACQATWNKFATWSEDKNCSGVGQRPQLPAKYRNAKPARVSNQGGLRFVETLDGSKKFPYSGRFYNAATDKCDVYNEGRLITSTLWSLCDQFKTGDIFHWSPSTRSCTHLVYGNDYGTVQAYRCGLKYESNEVTYKSISGSCLRTQGNVFTTVLSSSSCSALAALEDAYLWGNNTCTLYRNGLSFGTVDKTFCGRSENIRYEFIENAARVGQCQRVKDNGLYDIVANSYCQRPSRYVAKSLSSCTVSIDGVYQKLLFNGEEDCFIEGAASSAPVNDTSDYPICQFSSSDADGDGWGYENGRSCKVDSSLPIPLPVTQPEPLAPPPPETLAPPPPDVCLDPASDPDGDGWGWENGSSCFVATLPGSYVTLALPPYVTPTGTFNVLIDSKLSTPVTAELWLKEDGGAYTPYAEKQFTLYPGQNYQEATLHTFADPAKNYRIEVRILENFQSKEVFAQRISVHY